MKLKNYTSGVDITRTIARIELALAKAGASGISKDYLGGRLTALAFQVTLPQGKQISIRLPADGEAVYRTMFAEVKRPRASTEVRIREQADRTAWKLMQDWVEVQLSLIAMQQADFLQVFLPYVWDGRQSFYHKLKGDKFLLLPEAK